MTSLPPTNGLVREALLMLQQTQSLNDSDRLSQRERWAAQSDDHCEALGQALMAWDLFADLPDPELSRWSRLCMAADLTVAHFSDHPRRAGIAACALVALMIAPGLMDDSDTDVPRDETTVADYAHTDEINEHMIRYVTARGEQREITLPDGSRLWMNWNTEVLVAELDSEVHVDVVIGDAMFVAPPNRSKPLVVHAGHAVAIDPATEFAVHTHGLHDAFFKVRDGEVVVRGDASPEPVRVSSAQQIYFLNGQGSEVRAMSPRSIGDWREEKIVFDDRPLREALFALSHYTEQPVYVGEIADPNRLVNATFSMREADAALVQMANTYNLELLEVAMNRMQVRSVDRRRL